MNTTLIIIMIIIGVITVLGVIAGIIVKLMVMDYVVSRAVRGAKEAWYEDENKGN